MLNRLSKLLEFQWTPSSEQKFEEAEKNVMSIVQTPMINEKVQAGNHKLNTWYTTEANGPNVVLCHGWSAGVAFWAKNFDGLSEVSKVHAFDWLGFGRSDRPPFKGKTSKDAEQWWLESFEEWRKEMKLDKFVLVGHSLGGYLAASYALQHPERIQHLILASPVGVPHNPQILLPPHEQLIARRERGSMFVPSQGGKKVQSRQQGEMNAVETETARFILESAEEEQREADATGHSPSPNTAHLMDDLKHSQHQLSLQAFEKEQREAEERYKNLGLKEKSMTALINGIWKVSPNSLVKMLGPYGPTLIKNFCDRRFGNNSIGQSFHEYIFHSLAASGNSGAIATQFVLAPGAWAYQPLWFKFPKLKVPTTFLYGDQDWMDYRHGHRALQTQFDPKIASDCKLYVIPNSGHQLFIENPSDFNMVVKDIIQKTK